KEKSGEKKSEIKAETVINPILPPERHGITDIFRENPDSGLETVPISHAFTLRAHPESMTVLQLSDGRPLLILREIPKKKVKNETKNGGRTAMSAVSADTAGSALPLLPVWLPLVDKTVHFLTAMPKLPIEKENSDELNTDFYRINEINLNALISESTSLNHPCPTTEIPVEWQFRHVHSEDLEPRHIATPQPLISLLFLLSASAFFVAGYCLPKKNS
ncbi:MAG: hypothetical protein Q4C70_11320, partial [Planctomycetia bacterium]|nr:hypothetical protein [Planctomycetia bacterium]